MRRKALIVLLLGLALVVSACATGKEARGWRPGDKIICPGCGKEFAVPEKL
jgi:hypothetical protein